MAQGTGISPKDMYVEFSTDGSAWTNVSGDAAEVEPDGGERKTGGFFTFDGDTEGLTRGKREKMTVKINILYNETVSSAWRLAEAAYENNTALYARWAPKGNTSGNRRFTTSAGVVKNPPYAGGEAESADPIMTEVELEVASVTPAAIP